MLKKILMTILFLIFSNASFSQTLTIENTLKDMTVAWNKGDMNEFIQFYKNSESTIYVSKNIIKGYKNIEKRYLTSYPPNVPMGKLSTSNITVQVLSPTFAMVIGNWRLERLDKKYNGAFSLLMEKSNDRWMILIDHTS